MGVGEHALTLDVVVISLARAPERLQALRERLGSSSQRLRVIHGVDGSALDLQQLQEHGLLDESALTWPKGQVGCAMGHLRCILTCLRRNRPLMILEDDAVLAEGWELTLDELMRKLPCPNWELLLLGWNLDSCLQLEWQAGISMTALFQPRFPSQDQLVSALNHHQERSWFRLHTALGLAAYVINPRGAAKILSHVLPLRSLPITTPELPQKQCFSLDGQLNSLYTHLSSWACVPPLAMGINDKPSSLTAL